MKRWMMSFFLLMATALFSGCGGGGGDNNDSGGTNPPAVAAAVQGVAVNPQSGAPLAGATVNVYEDDSALGKSAAKSAAAATLIFTTTTDANGNFTLTGLLQDETYRIEFVATGFISTSYFQVVPGSTTVTLENVNLVPAAWATQTASVSGKVKNAATNGPLPNMTVSIRPGLNSRTGAATATATTNSLGAYSFPNLAAGVYTAEVTGSINGTPIITSYFTLVSFPGDADANSNQDFPVTTPLAAGARQYRIVLDWGNNPSDLDSHLTGPTSSGARFHTAYYAEDYPAGSTTGVYYRVAGPNTEAFLDVDNTEHGYDNGPETTTILVPRNGIYRFYVHHYEGYSSISASGAQVRLYKGNTLIRTFNPPSSSLGYDAVWSVFTMEVTSTGESITPVNSISMIDSESLPKQIPGLEEYMLFSALPAK